MSALIPREGRTKTRSGNPDENQIRPSPRRKGSGLKYVATIAVAAAADGLQIAFPPLWIPVSIIAALILFAIWGWRWEIMCVLVPELAPLVGIFPSWVAIALYLTARDAGSASKAGGVLRGEKVPGNRRHAKPENDQTSTHLNP